MFQLIDFYSQKSSLFNSLADKSNVLNRIYHISGKALIVLTPLALIMSPSALNMPVDLALGVIFPFHAHVGMNYIVSDYVPKAARQVARTSLLGVTILTAAGLLRLNLTGDGLTETLKSMWKPKGDQSKK